MLNIIFWLIFGFLIGWIGSVLITGSASTTLRMVIAGILGAILGGSCAQLVGSGQILLNRPDPSSIIAAVLSAVALVGLLHIVSGEPTSD